MAVRVHRGGDAAVTEQFLNGLGVDALNQQGRDRGVRQIMKPEPG